MNPQTIYKTRLSKDFTTLPNVLLRDKHLSFKARGVLAMVLSNNEDWTVTKGWLEKQGLEGREALRGAMAELEKAGYAVFVRERGDGSGFARQSWTFYDIPVPEKERSKITRGVSYGFVDDTHPPATNVDDTNPSPSERLSSEKQSSEKPVAETSAKAEAEKPSIDNVTTDHAKVFAWWKSDYLIRFGTEYPFGGRDGKAVKSLLKQFQTFEKTVDFVSACQDRAKDGYPFGTTTTLYDFANNIARLQAALAAPRPKNGRHAAPPAGVPIDASELPPIR